MNSWKLFRGDYSNLIVSVLINLGIPAKYAYIKRDCYGSEQDHICAAAGIEGDFILIDATMPYRKWYGFDCKHKEYELFNPREFEEMMKIKEDFFYNKALEFGNERLAGILYAPWICDEVILNTEDKLESLFYLIDYGKKFKWSLCISYIVYTNQRGYIPLMIKVNKNMEMTFQFSVKEPDSLWDANQWGSEYTFNEIPEIMKSEYFHRCLKNIDKNTDIIIKIMLSL